MVFIKELYPNPLGADNGAEWIKLGNNGEETISVTGWKIKDASGKTYIVRDGYILGHSELMFSNAETKISLGNKGDAIFLYDLDGKLIDDLQYDGEVREGAIITQNGNFYFPENQNLIEEDLSGLQANLSNIFSTSIWGTAIALGLIFAFVALFIVKRTMEE
jgi:hypothetical protein